MSLLAFATYVTIGSFGNFIGFTDWAVNIAWLWWLFLTAAFAFATTGVAALVVALRWDRPPAWVHPLLSVTPLSTVRHRAPHLHTHPAEATGARNLSERTVRRLHLASWLWGLGMIVGFGYVALNDRIPRPIDYDLISPEITDPANLAMFTLTAFGLLLSWRFQATGALLIAVGAAGLGLLASVEHPPAVAVAITAAFLVPAVLTAFAWQHHRSVAAVLTFAIVTGAVLTGVGVGATSAYDHFFGPAHPQSTLEPLPPSAIEWAWAGGTTTDTATVVAKLSEIEERRARLAVSPRADLADPQWVVATPIGGGQGVVRFAVDGLSPDTVYHYAVEVDGTLDVVRTGRFSTMPEGPSSFTVAVSACAYTGSNGVVFDTIREREPLLFLSTGDLHYANIDRDNAARFRATYDRVLTAPAQSALYRATSVAYVWDDHDYGGNDADRTSASRPAAQRVYRENVPHHDLPAGTDEGAVYQSFVVGRVRFIMTDTRSERDPQTTPDGPDKRMISTAQERWFTDELRQARDAGQVVAWVSPTPWIGPARHGSDTWAGYATARQRLADIIADAGVAERLVMLAGDAHMVALDDGRNTDYSTVGGAGFPLLQAAALDRPGGTKGGPYSHGEFPGAGQFGELEVRDDGTDIALTLRGLTYEGDVLVEHTVRVSLTPR
jgi:hypothetical protein